MATLNKSKRIHSTIKPVGFVLDELVNELGIRKKLREYDAVIYWGDIVGDHIAKVTVVRRISQGVLYVRVKTSVWRNELTLRKKELIDKINSVVSETVVKDIKFQ